MTLARSAYGIVFVGPPGKFSVWNVTPDGRLMDREVVERLGQCAARAGAVDYRPFPIDPPASANWFVPASELAEYEALILAAAGLPPSTPRSSGY